MVHQIFQHFPDFRVSEMKDPKQGDRYGLAEDAGTNKFKIAIGDRQPAVQISAEDDRNRQCDPVNDIFEPILQIVLFVRLQAQFEHDVASPEPEPHLAHDRSQQYACQSYGFGAQYR